MCDTLQQPTSQSSARVHHIQVLLHPSVPPPPIWTPVPTLKSLSTVFFSCSGPQRHISYLRSRNLTFAYSTTAYFESRHHIHYFRVEVAAKMPQKNLH